MSHMSSYTITDYTADPEVRALFAKRFTDGTDADGTPLSDLYQYDTDSRVLMATGNPPRVDCHSWTDKDRGKPHLSAIYDKLADRFDVISFGIDEVISPTEIELALYDIFTLGANGFGYMVETEGTPFDLIMDFETNYYGGDFPALMLCAEDYDYDQPVERIMDWAWAMIGNEATEQHPKSLAN